MRVLLKTGKWLLALLILAVAAVAGWAYQSPPELIKVGAGYAAKIVCSNVFVAGRDPDEVLRIDVQAPGHWLLGYMNVAVDRDAKRVTAGIFGIFGKGMAVARDGFGCASVPDGKIDAVLPVPGLKASPPPSNAVWPEGDGVEPSQDPAIAAILDDRGLTGPSMRAVVVVQNGRIVGERYGEGFSPETPLLGWSMTKSVNAAIIGTLVKAGKMAIDQKQLFEAWKADDRAAISLADLMAMSSGLEFNEDYGDVTDVTRMLYLEPDMARFAAAKPLGHPVGTNFNYSSGTASLLSRLWQNAAGGEALSYPKKALFDPIGMTSAVFETDASGTFAGSSYLYATARDWARFGQFMLQDGVWNGTQILPAGFVAWMREEAPASKGQYGKGQVWLYGPEGDTPAGEDPDTGFDVPGDAYWFEGHDGQSVAVIPSKQLAVVRLGLTPSTLAYKPQGLVSALAKVFD